MFISESFASGAAPAEFSMISLVPLLLIFLVFYFLIVRPQLKRSKEHHKMLSGLKVGNKIATSSGIIGIVRDIDEKGGKIFVEIADGVTVQMIRGHVLEVIHEKDAHKEDRKTSPAHEISKKKNQRKK